MLSPDLLVSQVELHLGSVCFAGLLWVKVCIDYLWRSSSFKTQRIKCPVFLLCVHAVLVIFSLKPNVREVHRGRILPGVVANADLNTLSQELSEGVSREL